MVKQTYAHNPMTWNSLLKSEDELRLLTSMKGVARNCLQLSCSDAVLESNIQREWANTRRNIQKQIQKKSAQEKVMQLQPAQQHALEEVVQQKYTQHMMSWSYLVEKQPVVIDSMVSDIQAAIQESHGTSSDTSEVCEGTSSSLRPNIQYEWTRVHIQHSNTEGKRRKYKPMTNKEHREQALREVSWKTEDEMICGYCNAILLPGYKCAPWPKGKPININPNGRYVFERWLEGRPNYPNRAEALRLGYDIRRKVVQGGFFCCNYGTEKKVWLPEIPKELWDVYLSSDREPPPPQPLRRPPQQRAQKNSGGDEGNTKNKRSRISSTTASKPARRASSNRSCNSNSNSVGNCASDRPVARAERHAFRPPPVPVPANDVMMIDDDDDDDGTSSAATTAASSCKPERELCWRHFSFN